MHLTTNAIYNHKVKVHLTYNKHTKSFTFNKLNHDNDLRFLNIIMRIEAGYKGYL